MKIAVDAFGGDNAPDEVLKGACAAALDFGAGIIFTGDEKRLRDRMSAIGLSHRNIEFAPAPRVIRVEDDPMDILKEEADSPSYPYSSMGKAFALCKSGEADAVVSAGSTAALVVGGTMITGRIRGVKRPALGPIMPSVNGYYILLDGGANIECRPEMLYQFAILGDIYMKLAMGIENPRVALLNIGTEAEKGRELERLTHVKLSAAPLNFIGNIEAREPVLGGCDVLVTDGYTGNVYLKTVEGMGKFMSGTMKTMFTKNAASKLGYLTVKKSVRAVTNSMDYREVGGSPLIGTAKPVIKAHGSSDARAFRNAVRQAMIFAEKGIIQEMTAALAAKPQAAHD
ncbi:phosphate acyltransferase [Clostridia bacterium]|nr:phosphate acyltransferase [Clostridia bacterium]